LRQRKRRRAEGGKGKSDEPTVRGRRRVDGYFVHRPSVAVTN
jgi:hypothetical protein